MFVKNRDPGSREEYGTVGPEAREYPRLNSPLTKKSLLQENPTILLGKPAILLDSISKRYLTKKGLVVSYIMRLLDGACKRAYSTRLSSTACTST